MRIAIVGSGNIGGGLARAWTAKGHTITFGARQPDEPEVVALAREIGAAVATIPDALTGAEVIVLAMPFTAAPAVAAALPSWQGRVVIDCTNPIGPGFTLIHGHTDSGSEAIQRLLPGAHVVKSFSAQGAENLAHPVHDGVPASNFYCGDDAAAKAVVKQLVEDVGFEAVDAGPLTSARYLEPITMLWISMSRTLGRNFAFKVLR
ncbi:MAG: NADPH-dependent F420 reductase [Acidobacteria bacterium]|nr:NADPH-dependent F420 reductase [Acidobacteriota bacterium]